MKNRISIDGDTTTVWLRRRSGEEIPCFIDTADLPMLLERGWTWSTKAVKHVLYAKANTPQANHKQGNVRMHRVLLGKACEGLHVDHMDGNGLNNRRANLRLVDAFDNQLNRHVTHSKSGFRGVTTCRGRFIARVKYRSKGHTYLGCFATAEEAAVAVREHLLLLGAPLEGVLRTTGGGSL